jgi:hypothetical protein
MTSPDKRIQELKEIMEKEKGESVSQEDAEKTAASLEGLANILFESWMEDQRRKKRLKENPKGFTLDGVGYSCFICGSGTRKDENWYDKWGIKCLICQAGIDRKEIPPSLVAHRESWYTSHELERAFNLKSSHLRKWLADGIIKTRTITNGAGRVHTQIFLIKDNDGFLPPKKMIESKMISFEREGETWHRSEEWYKFVNPFDHLKGYRIMDYMRVIPPEEMAARDEEEKKKAEERRVRREAKQKCSKPRKKRGVA